MPNCKDCGDTHCGGYGMDCEALCGGKKFIAKELDLDDDEDYYKEDADLWAYVSSPEFICSDCQSYGDDWRMGDDGEWVCLCGTCWNNRKRDRDKEN